ncbi:hypothetical protein DFH27DRAFT_560079 [Peziza echinospora]|nr:hypothetical protein DFH27DRAFT_560079 [Peziza echinospora]
MRLILSQFQWWIMVSLLISPSRLYFFGPQVFQHFSRVLGCRCSIFKEYHGYQPPSRIGPLHIRWLTVSSPTSTVPSTASISYKVVLSCNCL